MINDTTADFGLMIKNITVEDTYCRYTCACGINHYTETLNLKVVGYVYPPDIHSNIIVEKGGNYQIDIQLDVYPYPTCVLTYETSVLPVNITITSTKYNLKGGNLQLYNVHIMHTLDVHKYICKGEIILTCNVGKKNYTGIQKSIDFCKDKIILYHNPEDQKNSGL
ncbi:unnamed protein product [Mytilus coruscus]|uniref:Uncharacterized protein n=1 Tax=Mytilus coruscus TaxID=42192 RepID=A0A6J8CUJ0_MYTCO|nr:unnamed protein product [Mytilus coruscus]